MKWNNALKDYKHYLNFERGLSKNSIESYSLDVIKLIRFLNDNNIYKSPLTIDSNTIKEFVYQVAKVVNERSQARLISGLKSFFSIADYITVNISSPNTEGLRDFHDQEKLEDLLLALNKIKSENKINIPLLLKVSPDIRDNHISEIVDVAIKNDISAIILTNTTNGNRDNLVSEIKKEEGGLSGEPLQQISTNMIKKFYKQLNGKIPIIGVGGVNSGKSAYEKIIAGASLLQLYTGLVYKGPSIVKNIKKELIQILKVEGLNNIKDAIGKNL